MVEGEFLSESEKTSKVFQVGERFGLQFKDSQKFEFFFYTTLEDNASNLAIELFKMNYELEPVIKSTNKEWLINGWTLEMKFR